MSNRYVNVVIDRQNYDDLKTLGEVPDTFNGIIKKLLIEKQPLIAAIRQAKQQQTNPKLVTLGDRDFRR